MDHRLRERLREIEDPAERIAMELDLFKRVGLEMDPLRDWRHMVLSEFAWEFDPPTLGQVLRVVLTFPGTDKTVAKSYRALGGSTGSMLSTLTLHADAMIYSLCGKRNVYTKAVAAGNWEAAQELESLQTGYGSLIEARRVYRSLRPGEAKRSRISQWQYRPTLDTLAFAKRTWPDQELKPDDERRLQEHMSRRSRHEQEEPKQD